MKLAILSSVLLSAVSATVVSHDGPQYAFSNPPIEEVDFRIPTVHESAVMARRIMHLAYHGDLVTVFPSQHQSATSGEDEIYELEARPQGVGGSPIGLMEYIADCEPDTGNPTMLAIDIATPFRNYRAGSNISLSLRWWPHEAQTYSSAFSTSSLLHAWDREDVKEIPTPHTAAALPRFSLQGRLEPIDMKSLHGLSIPPCFVRKHPDSVYWQPRTGVHESGYVRFVVEEVYWFGGFGDRSRIGWLPVEEWRNVTRKEIEECRLPGEPTKKERQNWFRDLL